MKKNYVGLGLAFTIALSTVAARAQQISTIDDYNKTLIKNGISWNASQAGTYSPSFYTGFAPRMEDPNRIHLHLARGNQIRLTVPLDEYSVFTYLYGLKKREALFDKAVSEGLIKPVQQNQMGSYKAIMQSGTYRINELIQKLENGSMTREQFYQESLTILKELNKDRVFDIKLDLTAAIEKWKDAVAKFASEAGGSNDSAITKNPQKAIALVNDLLFGRVNLTFITPEIKAKLISVIEARSNSGTFEQQAIELFNLATKGRFDFKVERFGKMVKAIRQEGSRTILDYPEFTAIYPNGSVRTNRSDRSGNSIPVIREIGALNFVERSYHDVDHIRSEPYYGFIPKMDYTAEGNGVHNPAVRTYLRKSIYSGLYAQLNIPKTNDTLWVVARGNVSHGCTRMAAGHILELREVFPSNSKRMAKVTYFGNDSRDYDLYDIDGDGTPEVMGVQYYIAYAIGGDEGEAYREGAGLTAESFNREAFYTQLYGAKNQFRVAGDGSILFANPSISEFAYVKSQTGRGAAFSVQVNGEYKLYEQKYEQDKMQFYKMSSTQMSSLQESADNASTGKQLVRLFGRASGCGIFKAEYPLCNEDNFNQELNTLTSKATKVK